jgi:DNA mismatch endonuclease (patch repair protein)
MVAVADVHSKDIRSYNMSQIKGKDTKPEVIVRKFLFSKGLRFRKNDKRYPGHPDIVLPKYKTMIFVHGCFWHFHEGCRYAVMPSSNTAFWENKLYTNRDRDRRNQETLSTMGWNVITVWECELKKNKREETLNKLYRQIIDQKNSL